MLGGKRDCYDIFSGSQAEKDLVDFMKQTPLEQWKQLMKEAEPLGKQFKECVIYEGVLQGFCDISGNLTAAST